MYDCQKPIIERKMWFDFLCNIFLIGSYSGDYNDKCVEKIRRSELEGFIICKGRLLQHVSVPRDQLQVTYMYISNNY